MTTKLSKEDVIAIRQSTESCMKLAERFGVGVETVRRARRGQTWSHVHAVAQPWSSRPGRPRKPSPASAGPG
jgi:hypothetical protein